MVQKLEADLLDLLEAPDIPWLSLLFPMGVERSQFE